MKGWKLIYITMEPLFVPDSMAAYVNLQEFKPPKHKCLHILSLANPIFETRDTFAIQQSCFSAVRELSTSGQEPISTHPREAKAESD